MKLDLRRAPLARLALQVALSALFMAGEAWSAEIHEAARSGDVEKIKALLSADASQINAVDEHGATPLHVAKDSATTVTLLAAHPLLDVKDDQGRNPLDAAVADGRVAVAAAIVDNLVQGLESLERLRQLVSPAYGNTADAALIAIQNEDLPWLTSIVEGNPDVVRQASITQQFQPLEAAVTVDWVEGARFLLEHGADVNHRDPELGSMPLHEATAQRNAEVAALLLDFGADINAKMKSNDLTALHIASMNNSHDLLVLLLSRGADAGIKAGKGLTPLDIAVETHQDESKFFLKLYDKLKAKRFRDWRDLLGASSEGRVADIERIGTADRELLNIATELDLTPLHMAAERNQPAAVEALIRLGADPQARSAGGRTALEMTSDSATVAALRRAGLYTAEELKAFMTAASRGDIPALQSALDACPKLLNGQDEYHGTALHWAASASAEAVDFLLARGADTKLKDDIDGTAKETAKRYKCEGCLQMFKKHGK